MSKDKHEKGRKGEEIGKMILEKMGFELEMKKLDDDNHVPSFDILAKRWGQRYAINIKYGDVFSISRSNLERFEIVKKNSPYRPAYLFVSSENHYWFYSLDIQIPSSVDTRFHKLEKFT